MKHGQAGGIARSKALGHEGMAELGRKGAQAFWRLYRLQHLRQNDFLIIRKSDGAIMPKTLCGLSSKEYLSS